MAARRERVCIRNLWIWMRLMGTINHLCVPIASKLWWSHSILFITPNARIFTLNHNRNIYIRCEWMKRLILCVASCLFSIFIFAVRLLQPSRFSLARNSSHFLCNLLANSFQISLPNGLCVSRTTPPQPFEIIFNSQTIWLLISIENLARLLFSQNNCAGSAASLHHRIVSKDSLVCSLPHVYMSVCTVHQTYTDSRPNERMENASNEIWFSMSIFIHGINL